MAWGTDDEVDAWLALEPDMSPGQAERYRAQLVSIRRQGHVIEAQPRATPAPDLARLTDERRSPWRDGHLYRMLVDHGTGEHIVTDLDPAEDYLIHAVGAPVFGPGHSVEMSLTLIGFDAPLPGSEIAGIAAEVRAAACRATAAIVGSADR